jgi:hypothetical protein
MTAEEIKQKVRNGDYVYYWFSGIRTKDSCNPFWKRDMRVLVEEIIGRKISDIVFKGAFSFEDYEQDNSLAVERLVDYYVMVAKLIRADIFQGINTVQIAGERVPL